MNRRLLYVLIITVAMVISVTCQPDAMLAPPGRPSEFRTPDQLRSYLKALNDYYAIVGRPRFGRSVDKSQMEKAYEDAVNNFWTNLQICRFVKGECTSAMYCDGILGIDFGDVWYDFLSRDTYDYMEDSKLPFYNFED